MKIVKYSYAARMIYLWIQDGLIDLFATYFTFDITYPKGVNGILLFLQHYVLGLKDQQVVPSSTSKLIANLSKLTND